MNVKKSIAGYYKDDEDHWVAELVCGHFQHVRHKPPWVNRRWTQTRLGRDQMVGYELNCKKCDEGMPADTPTG